nr:hypothetical protein Iba_chr01bCG1980 [Ipomoea batatas]
MHSSVSIQSSISCYWLFFLMQRAAEINRTKSLVSSGFQWNFFSATGSDFSGGASSLVYSALLLYPLPRHGCCCFFSFYMFSGDRKGD